MSTARKAHRTVVSRESRPGRGRGNLGLGASILGLAVAVAIIAAIAAGQTTSTWREPSPPPPPKMPASSGNPVRPAPEAGPPGDSSLRNRLRSIISRMPPEEPAPATGESPAWDDARPPAAEPRPTRGPVRIPIGSPREAEAIEIKQSNGMISLSVRDAPLNRVLMLLGQQLSVNIVCTNTISTPISVALDRVPLEAALTSICSIAGCTWTCSNGIIHVTSVASSTKLSAEVQGRQLRVFRLDYTSATELEAAVKGMLSPVGSSFITKAMPTDNRKTEDVMVVQDLPSYVQCIEQYVSQVDRPPRQVLIEAHVLEVNLKGDCTWGVNWKLLFGHLDASNVEIKGFADAKAPQAFSFSFKASDMTGLIEALRTQTDAKSLASPKVLVLNGQEARLQIGKQLGFRVVTTTETSSMESIQFLDTGVVLKVTPRVTRDGQILMHVRPEVSDGNIDASGLPQSVTTHVESNVMLPDGRGMVIGGLIDEKDREEQQKVPWLGDLWLVGRLFQRKTVHKERREIIITLLPRIVPDCLSEEDRHAVEVLRTQTPLVCGPLERVHRPWEARLPDAIENPWCPGDYSPWRKSDGCHPACPSEGPGGESPQEPYYWRERRPESCPPESSQPGPAAQAARETPLPPPYPSYMPDPSPAGTYADPPADRPAVEAASYRPWESQRR